MLVCDSIGHEFHITADGGVGRRVPNVQRFSGLRVAHESLHVRQQEILQDTTLRSRVKEFLLRGWTYSEGGLDGSELKSWGDDIESAQQNFLTRVEKVSTTLALEHALQDFLSSGTPLSSESFTVQLSGQYARDSQLHPAHALLIGPRDSLMQVAAEMATKYAETGEGNVEELSSVLVVSAKDLWDNMGTLYAWLKDQPPTVVLKQSVRPHTHVEAGPMARSKIMEDALSYFLPSILQFDPELCILIRANQWPNQEVKFTIHGGRRKLGETPLECVLRALDKKMFCKRKLRMPNPPLMLAGLDFSSTPSSSAEDVDAADVKEVQITTWIPFRKVVCTYAFMHSSVKHHFFQPPT
jgi:hypothetical protein